MNRNDFKPFSAMLSDVADYYRQPLAPAAIQVWWKALERFDLTVIRALLNEHVQSSKFMPAVSELLDRVKASDGRPGPEEAWAMIPRDEGVSVVWTEEMARALEVANPLLREGESIAARMAFLERYRELVREARDAGRAVRWTTSLGHDPADRERALLTAQRRGLLTARHVAGLLPYRGEPAPEIAALIPDMSKPVGNRTLKDALKAVREQREKGEAPT